ncbi:hypothetical protein [Actinoplanes sp. NPDC051494]|uniref:hypothetical protein n=1 Tax=Actinoplanes sp. NPDC051494 TaxID=3363907 RepID=UPI0037A44795
MINLDDLPDRRPLPPAVRTVARQRLGEGIAERTGARTARAAATGVTLAVFAVTGLGAVLLHHLRTGDAPTAGHAPAATPAGPGNSDTFHILPVEQRYAVHDGVSAADAARCGRAQAGTVQNGRSALGTALFTASARGATVVAYRSGDTARFCELTPETVSLSVAGAPAGDADLTYLSPTGTAAGIVGPDVKSLSVFDDHLQWPTTTDGEPAVVRDGVFVLPNSLTAAPGTLRLSVGATASRAATTIAVDAAHLPAAVAPRTDRPQPSPGQAAFAPCRGLAGFPPLVDAHAWKTTGRTDLTVNDHLHLARYDGMLAVCTTTGAAGSAGTAELLVDDGADSNGVRADEVPVNPYLFTHTVFYDFSTAKHGSETVAVTGLVTDDRAATVSLSGTGHRAITVPVIDRTFVLAGINLNDGADQRTITVYGDDGRVLAEQPINL